MMEENTLRRPGEWTTECGGRKSSMTFREALFVMSNGGTHIGAEATGIRDNWTTGELCMLGRGLYI